LLIGGLNETQKKGTLTVYAFSQNKTSNLLEFRQELESKHSDLVTCLIQLNRNYLATSSFDKKIMIWFNDTTISKHEDIPSYKHVETLNEHLDIVLTLCNLTPILKGNNHERKELRMASSSTDKKIIIWSALFSDQKLGNFEAKQILNGHSDVAYSLLFFEEKQVFVSGSVDENIIFWSYNSQNEQYFQIQTLQTNSGVWSLTELSKNLEFASGHENGSIKIWSYKQEEFYLRQSLDNQHSDTIHCLLHLDNGDLISASPNDTNKINIYYFNLFENEFILKQSLNKINFPITSLVKLTDGLFASSNFEDMSIKIWTPISVN